MIESGETLTTCIARFPQHADEIIKHFQFESDLRDLTSTEWPLETGRYAFNESSPTAVTLFNYDADRDAFAGRVVLKGASGVSETDLTKYQNWRTAILSSNLTLSGNINLTLWSAMKDFGTGKRGTVTAYLRDFNGSTYTTIATATLDQADWSTGSSGWKEKRLRLMALVIQYRPEPDSKSR